jgi:WD40-like Beta Propeller Repeat
MGSGASPQLLYDVSDALHPRLLCTIQNTSVHLFTGDTFVYLRPVSATETDIVLHSLGSGNESVAGRFPFDVAAGAWTPDGSPMAYLGPVSPNSSGIDTQSVMLYAQQKSSLLYSYPIGIGDCICRFGLPPQVLALSPDGQYLAVGQLAGKGSGPLAVIRLSDGKQVYTAILDVGEAIWARTGHRLLLFEWGGFTADAWTPEAGVVALHAVSWPHLPGVSPDGTRLAYTSAADDSVTSLPPRVYVYSLSGGAPKMLIDQPRSQVVFINDRWVWYLEEVGCDSCPGSTAPSGKVYAMDLSAGVEQTVTFAPGEAPLGQRNTYWPTFGPGEFWPTS